MDWESDDSLLARIGSMDRHQRYRTAVMALRRLRAPLVEIPMPTEWGVRQDLVSSLFVTLTAEPTDALAEAVHTAVGELRAAPLFESEWDPELTEEIQLDTIDGLLTLGATLMDPDPPSTEQIVSKARSLSHYLDECIADSLMPEPDKDAQQLYLSRLGDEVRAYDLGYFGSRNLELEFACHAAIIHHDSHQDFFSSAAGQELLTRGNDYSAELVTSLRRLSS